jgi:hypothetical protein
MSHEVQMTAEGYIAHGEQKMLVLKIGASVLQSGTQ